MIKLIKGMFSSSAPAPTSSDHKEGEKEDAANETLDSEAQDDTGAHENNKEASRVIPPNTDTMEPPSLPNGTPRAGNRAAVTSSAVKGSSAKKNKGKMSTDARYIKNQKKKERKQKKRDAADSSVLDSSVMDSSVMGDDTEPLGMGRRNSNLEESFVSPNLSRRMGALFGELPVSQAVMAPPKPKMSKKAKKAAKKQLKDQANTTTGLASQLPQESKPMEEETQDLQTVIRQAQLVKNKEKTAQEAVKSVPVAESEESRSRRQSQSDEVGLVEETEMTNQEAQVTYQRPLQESITAPQDENDSLPLRPPPTPALSSPSQYQEPSQPTAEDIAEAEAQIRSNAWSTGDIKSDPEEDDDDEPIQPSRKARGKRKAFTPIVKPSAKRRKSKETEESLPTLASYGFVASNTPSQTEEDQAAGDGSPSASLEPSILGQEAANIFRSQMEEFRTPVPEIPASPSIAVNSSQQRRPTPAFTPINPQKRLAGVVIQVPARSPYELPPSSQPHSESEPELPREQSQPQTQTQPESDPEPEQSQKPPSPTERRKRRLPTGGPDSSQVKPKIPRRLRNKSELALEPAKSMTPKQSASKAKTPKSRTPKASGSSKATPASKGTRLSSDDVKSIEDAVEAYREQNDLKQVDLNARIQDETKNNPEFWTYMYEETPHLPRVKIQNHCRRNFHNFESRRSWNEEADQDLKDAYERNPRKWKQIGAELNRFSEDCKDRWRNYVVCGDKLKKEHWTRGEEEKLRDIIEDLLSLILKDEGRDWEDLTENDQTKLDWLKVSEKMDHARSRLQCQTKWKAILEREDSTTKDPVAKKPISETAWRLEVAVKIARTMKAKEKLALLYLVRDSKAGKEGTIPWTAIQKELGVRGRRMAFRVCYRNMKLHVPGNKKMKLQEIVSALIDLYEAASPREPKGFNNFISAGIYNDARKLKRSSRSVSKDNDDDEDEDDDEADEEEEEEEEEEDEDEEEEEDELEQSVSAEKQISTQKKQRASSVKNSNGEGPSKPTPRLHLNKGRKAAMLSEMDQENDHTPVKTRSPKKLRSRMKVLGQKESQESQAGSGSGNADDIGEAFQAVKSSQATGRSPRVAKKPIVGARTSRGGQKKSEKWAYESEDEDEAIEPVVMDDVEAGRSKIDLGEVVGDGGVDGNEDAQVQQEDEDMDQDENSVQRPDIAMDQDEESVQPDIDTDQDEDSVQPDIDTDQDEDSVQPDIDTDQDEDSVQPDINTDHDEDSVQPDIDMDASNHELEVAESDHNIDDAAPLNGHVKSSNEDEIEDEDKQDDFPSTNHNTESVDLDEASHITPFREIENSFPDETGINDVDEQRGVDGEESNQESEDWMRLMGDEADGNGEAKGDIEMNGDGNGIEDADSGSEYGSPKRRVSSRNGLSSKENPRETSYFGRSSRNGNSQPNGGLDIEDSSDDGESDVGIPAKITPKPFLRNGFRQDTGSQVSRLGSEDEDSSSDDSDENIPHTPKEKKFFPSTQGRGMGMSSGMGAGLGTEKTRGMLRSGRLARGQGRSVEL
ncbi:uncharacterized protein RSE6_11023 [Rhynchosporium secalis]|uniref:Uncharacterized protein n=1 Tax=Rhynchosporium secalis TaxID=38038 RepID=A0A1E1MMY1_RHYSE|nr:uncharacterized protein RSE6_11023 [Rhynchosporium secalis]